MKRRLSSLLIAVILLLSACGGGQTKPTPSTAPAAAETPTPTPEPTPTPYGGPVNPLTGLPLAEGWENRRPIAIMLNNLKAALPQLGVSKADIIYEVLAEGGITRMLGVYQSVEGVGAIGSVRSSRPYYLELALGHDAVYLHAGGSEDAYAKIKEWGVTALDCVRGPYEGTSPGSNLFWRDAGRKKANGMEHSVITTGETIIEKFKGYTFRQEHKEDYRYDQAFSEEAVPAWGKEAAVVSVPFSSYKTGVFTYDPDTGLYQVEEYGKAYIDGDTGEQVSVKNVIVLKTRCKVIDSVGRMSVDLTSGGDGYFICDGMYASIRWSKKDRDSQFVYTTIDGSPVVLVLGSRYENIVPLENDITVK